MAKKYSALFFASISLAYISWRITSISSDSTLLSWALFSIEVITIAEIGFALFANYKYKKPAKKNVTQTDSDCTAIIDARFCSDDDLKVTLYSIQESNEFTSARVIDNETIGEARQNVYQLFSKTKRVSNFVLTDSDKQIAWINPGDVVLNDMASQSQTHADNNFGIAIPKIAFWSNAISNGSSPNEKDLVGDKVSDFISQYSSTQWAGETSLFSQELTQRLKATPEIDLSDFTKVNAFANSQGMRISHVDVIGVEQQDQNANARITSRINEIRVAQRHLFKGERNSNSLLSACRYASRPLRALRTFAFMTLAGICVASGSLPYPQDNASHLFITVAFFIAAAVSIKLSYSVQFDQVSRVRHNLSNIGSDLVATFTSNPKFADLLNKFIGPALAVYLSFTLIYRWVVNFGNDQNSQNSAPAILFGIIALGVLVYGLELVGFRQRRNTLRRILNVNAKFGRRAIEIADLSPQDCGVISARDTKIGHKEVITLSLPVGEQTQTISLPAVVVNSTKVGPNYRVGFVFEEIPKQEKDILVKFCTLTYPQYALRGFSKIVGETQSRDISISNSKRNISTFANLRNQTQKPLVRIAAIVALFAVAAGNLPPYSGASAATTTGAVNTISGIAYSDFNANGVKDPGSDLSATDTVLTGVQVKATCDNSGTTTSGTATTNDQGEFIISNVLGQCRVEIIGGIPDGMKSAAVGSDSNTFVQFHRSGTANVMFGLHYPGEYCQNNPNVVVTCFGRGNNTVTVPNKGAILSNTWNSTGGWSDVSTYGKVGTVYGLAYKSDTKELFSSAYLRRKAGLGPMGIGGIYKTDMSTGARPVTQWLNLETTAQSFGETLGANPRPANQSAYDLAVNDDVTEEWVGRRGIGDIDISPDNKTLYATNLNTGSIYAINIANPSLATRIVVSGNLPTSQGRTCNRGAGDFRIFGLGVKGNGELYVGGVCTAQSTQNHDDLYYYVFKFDPKNNFGQKLVSTHDLKYDRTKTTNPWQSRVVGTPYPGTAKQNNTVVRWEPWQAKQQARFVADNTIIYPYPSISDITFDGEDLIVGMRDIYSDTMPPNGQPAPGSLALFGSAHGDLVRLCGSKTSDQYTLESNRSCPDGRKASGVTPNYSESFNGDRSFDTNHHFTFGPGGGEWFTGEDPWEFFGEGAIGAVAKPGGFNKFAATQSDPANYQFFGNTTSAWSAGTRWFDAKAGTSSRGNTVYDPNMSDWTFSKAGGLGDLEALCDEAPLQIGNRVWKDDNANGIQDPSEPGINGVTVELLNSNNEVIQTTQTNPNGEYLFSNVPKNTDLSVRINVLLLSGLSPTNANSGSNDSIDSDGVLNVHHVMANVSAHSPGDNDHTFDFGFKPVYALGNLVFDDLNNNGIKESNETGIANVPVTLLNGNGTPTGKTTLTDSNGKYYFANLDGGSYIVEITPPANYRSSTGNNGQAFGPFEPAPSPDTAANLKIDNDDNGSKSNSTIRSAAITLGAGRAPVGEVDGGNVNLPDSQNDYTVDFGLFRSGSIGDFVWNDSNKDGIQTNGETGVPNVNVTLYVGVCGVGGTSIATTSTDSNGIYNFDNLGTGTYFVAFQLPNGSVFTSAFSGSDVTKDSNANTTTGCSGPTVLDPGGIDRTIDAGLTPKSVPIDLTLKKNITNKPSAPESFNPGDIVDYELVVSNKGPGTAQIGFKVDDLLPAGLTFLGSPISSGYNCTISGQSLSCVSDHSLAKDVIEKITYKAKISNTFTTSTNSLRNIAKITPSNTDEPEDNPLSNCDAIGGDVQGRTCNNVDPETLDLPIDLEVDKTIDRSNNPAFRPGTNVEYILTVKNNGPATAKSGFKVEDLLPNELTYISATGTGYTCVPNGQTVVCTSDHTLSVGTTETIRLVARIKSDLTISGQTIKNIVTVKPSTSETYTETTPLDPCSPDGTNKDECNNRDPESFPLPNGASLGDFVWYDLNHDGIQNTGEKGISGITVELYENTCSGSALRDVTTDIDGKYIFGNLVPGTTYFVKFVTKNGLVLTTPNAGNDSTDSDATANGCSAGVALAGGEFNSSIDAGMYLPWASIGDYVFNDANKNGIQDSGELPVAGVSVSLRDSSGSAIRTTTTNDQGKYSFTQLEPGEYSIAFVIPSGYSLSPRNAGSNTAVDSDPGTNGITQTTTLSPGENDTTWDMGIFVTPASLGNFVWFDDNNNGRQDSGEDVAGGLTVQVFGSVCGVGTPIAQTTTDDQGRYLFENLAPGTYTIKFEKPVGMSFAKANAVNVSEALDSDADSDGCSSLVALAPGDSNLDIDAGIVVLATLGDFVWLDFDRDGIQNDDDFGIPGVVVTLLDGDGNEIPGRETVTDEDGFYIFDGLLPGDYIVRFDETSLPILLQISPKDRGNNDALDSDVNQDSGETDVISLGSGERNLTVDLGLNPIPVAFGDFVWEDLDKDGIQDSGEPGISNIRVDLFYCDSDIADEPLDSVVTDSDGNYFFDNLEPDSYVVRFETPQGMVPTLSFQGDDTSKDSEVENDGFSWCVDLPPGIEDLTIDAGFYKPDVPPVSVLPNVVTRNTGGLPVTGAIVSQALAFGISLLGAGLLLTGFFTQKKRKLKFF